MGTWEKLLEQLWATKSIFSNKYRWGSTENPGIKWWRYARLPWNCGYCRESSGAAGFTRRPFTCALVCDWIHTLASNLHALEHILQTRKEQED